MYRVHAQNSRERRSACVREEREGEGEWEVGRVVLPRCGTLAGMKGEFDRGV